MRKINVGVLCGGKSGEHEVSLASGSSIIKGLNEQKYNIIPLCISQDGKWMMPSESFAYMKNGGYLTDEYSNKIVISGRLEDYIGLREFNKDIKREIDVIIPALHGTFGEDGTIQGLLDIYEIPYVGAGAAASAVAMDKSFMKILFQSCGLPVCNYLTVKRGEWNRNRDEIIRTVEKDIGIPLFVKPVNLGSSVGISKVKLKEDLEGAVDLACTYDSKVIIEEAVNAREIECSVLGNDEPAASVPAEIIPKGEFYDYESKYTPGMMEFVYPAPFSEDKINEIRSYAVKAFTSVDCCGMARVDFLMDRDTQKVYVSEINTIPGFTETSVYARLFEESGIPYGELLDKLIELAFEKHKEKNVSKYIFDRL